MLTQEKLKEILNYDADNGVFTWLYNRVKFKSGDEAGFITGFGYRRIELHGKQYFAHRLAWLYMNGEFPEFSVDHIDGDKLNNQWLNLREATMSQNMQNQTLRRKNASGFIGVYFHNVSRKWRSRIMLNGKYYNLGYFKTPEDASAAYIKAKKEIHVFNPVLR